MKTFIITQLHTFEYVYEIEADNREQALMLLHQVPQTPVSEEFHHMNDREDWTIEEDHT